MMLMLPTTGGGVNRVIRSTEKFVKDFKAHEHSGRYEEGDWRRNIEAYTGTTVKQWGDAIPEWVKVKGQKALEAVAPVVQGTFEDMKRIDNKYDPREYIDAGGAYALQGIGIGWDWGMGKISDLTGVDRTILEVGEFFVPWSKLGKIGKLGKVSKTAQKIDKASDVVRTVNVASDVSRTADVASDVARTADVASDVGRYSKGAEYAWKAQKRLGVADVDQFMMELGETAFLKKSPTKEIFTKAQKVYPLRKIGKWQKVLKDITKTGDDMRRASAAFLTSGFGPGDYKQFSKYISKNWGGPVTSAITNIHHVGFLEKLKRIPLAHNSFKTIQNAAKAGQILESPIVMQLRKMGVELGNFAQNTADVLETITAGSRSFKVNAVFDQFGGTLNRQTIDDLFQGTWLRKGVGEISDITKSDMDAFRALSKEFPKRKGDVFPQSSIETSTQLKGDKFPEIRINQPDGTLVEVWTPKNWDEWNNRFQIVSEKLGIKNKFNRKAIKISSKLDIYSNDHSIVHSLTELAEKTKGNPVYDAQQAVTSGAIRNMDIDKATKLQYQSLNSMERILGNVLQRRVQKVIELFEELNPGKKFTDLLPEEQQIFFRTNVNEIATKGGFRDAPLTLPQALKPVKGDLTLLENLFGFTPQTF